MKRLRIREGIATALIVLSPSAAIGAIPANVTNAMYQVPAAIGSEEHARFKVQDLSFVSVKGSRHISFRLPEDLSGRKTTVVDLKEVPSTPGAAFVLFGGDSAGEAASCVLGANTAFCLIHYRTEATTPSEIERFLTGKYHNTALVRPKLAVALNYQNDPAGVLRFSFSDK